MKDADNRLDVMKDKMATKDLLIAHTIVPLIGINLAFLAVRGNNHQHVGQIKETET